MNRRCTATNRMARDMADENEPPPVSKLTRTKQRWAREGRFLTGKTSPPEERRLAAGTAPHQGLACPRSGPDTGDFPRALAARCLWRGRNAGFLGFRPVHRATADKIHFRHPLRDHMVAVRQPMGGAGDPRSP